MTLLLISYEHASDSRELSLCITMIANIFDYHSYWWWGKKETEGSRQKLTIRKLPRQKFNLCWRKFGAVAHKLIAFTFKNFSAFLAFASRFFHLQNEILVSVFFVSLSLQEGGGDGERKEKFKD